MEILRSREVVNIRTRCNLLKVYIPILSYFLFDIFYSFFSQILGIWFCVMSNWKITIYGRNEWLG